MFQEPPPRIGEGAEAPPRRGWSAGGGEGEGDRDRDRFSGRGFSVVSVSRSSPEEGYRVSAIS